MPGADQLAGADFSFADDAVLRRDDARVVQVGAGQHEGRLFDADIGTKNLFLRIQDGALALLRFDFREGGFDLCFRALQVGLTADDLRGGGSDLGFAAGQLRTKTFFVGHCLFQLLAAWRIRSRRAPPAVYVRGLYAARPLRCRPCHPWRLRRSNSRPGFRLRRRRRRPLLRAARFRLVECGRPEVPSDAGC